jgi:hypothetical protein
MQMGEEGPIVELPVDVVASALNTAKENGHDVSDWTVEDICLDLIAYEYDCEDVTVEQLTPLVQAWKDCHGTHAVRVG